MEVPEVAGEFRRRIQSRRTFTVEWPNARLRIPGRENVVGFNTKRRARGSARRAVTVAE
jgi:hypothetical protein